MDLPEAFPVHEYVLKFHDRHQDVSLCDLQTSSTDVSLSDSWLECSEPFESSDISVGSCNSTSRHEFSSAPHPQTPDASEQSTERSGTGEHTTSRDTALMPCRLQLTLQKMDRDSRCNFPPPQIQCLANDPSVLRQPDRTMYTHYLEEIKTLSAPDQQKVLEYLGLEHQQSVSEEVRHFSWPVRDPVNDLCECVHPQCDNQDPLELHTSNCRAPDSIAPSGLFMQCLLNNPGRWFSARAIFHWLRERGYYDVQGGPPHVEQQIIDFIQTSAWNASWSKYSLTAVFRKRMPEGLLYRV